MASVQIGSIHSESFSLSCFQTGQNHISVNLRSDLFNSDSSDWLCSCSSLQVPLDETRYFSEGAMHSELFNIRRLQHNTQWRPETTYLFQEPGYADVTTDIHAVAGGSASSRRYTVDGVGRVRTDRFEIRQFGDFVEALIQWYQHFNMLMRSNPLVAGDFNQAWDQSGAIIAGTEQIDANTGAVIAGTGHADQTKRKFEHLRVRISASGNISFIFSSLFASNFYIECSEYAREIFGVPQYISYAVNVSPATLRDTVHDGVVAAGGFFTMVSPKQDWAVADSDWMQTLALNGTKSIFSSVDTRMSIALTTDLPLKKSFIITDEAEEFSSVLVENPLDNEFEVTSLISDQFHSEFHVQGRSRAGQYMVKRPSDIAEWVSLASDINVRTIRLRLALRERVFISTGKWGIKVSPLIVESHAAWSCKLIFAKRIH